MLSKEITKGILNAIAVLLGFIVLGWFLYQIQSVVLYIIISAIISLIGRPLILFLKNQLRFNNLLAVIITMVFIYGFFIGLLLLFIPLIRQQSHNLSLLNIESFSQTIENLYSEMLAYFAGSNIDIETQIENSGFLNTLDFGFIPEFINTFLAALGSFSIGLFSVIFISFFLLKDSKLMESGLLTLIPDEFESRFSNSLNKIKSLLSRYFIGLVFQILILFIIYSFVLLLFGIDNAIVIAFLCALLNIIPYVGPIIGGILMFFLTMSSNLGQDFSTVILPTTIYVMIGFIIGQLIDNFLSQPLIFSKSVKSHPLEIFLIIVIGGLLFGILGMIAAVPFYTAIKVISKEFLFEYKIVKGLTKDI
ncbi:AI-2E family transporter [Planktosalinus lacus]|uniref:AI-2E family transporter n=1 Tax=Planktosalinus lacus TaxID=1526573 RepID=A0A8J2VB44_9FLAO|nr:AI-2E family transporter [Planktosalinus lacus]GGD94527.1 AI-2E family transporter [Planktosalinus lacus]